MKLELLETKTKLLVKNNCPRGEKIMDLDELSFERCKSCEFFIKPDKHGWKEYRTKVIRDDSETDGIDDPCTYYTKVINCCKCGNEIVFGSGYSTLTKGVDKEKCQKCGTFHFFSEWCGKKDSEHDVFLVPLEDGDFSLVVKPNGKRN